MAPDACARERNLDFRAVRLLDSQPMVGSVITMLTTRVVMTAACMTSSGRDAGIVNCFTGVIVGPFAGGTGLYRGALLCLYIKLANTFVHEFCKSFSYALLYHQNMPIDRIVL